MDDLFPKIQRSIEALIEDEEGNIPGKKLLMLGTMVIILGSLFSTDAFARHKSHSSHRSHKSHSSGSHRNGGSHSSHVSHQSHQSHTSSGTHNNHSNHASHSSHANVAKHSDHGSHASHTSHSNTASHSNSRYSAEGDVTYSAPSVKKIQGITAPPVVKTEELFTLPDVNQNIESPSGTPGSGILPDVSVPASTAGVKIDAGNMKAPSSTDLIE